MQKEYSNKISNASSKEEADKLKAEYDKKVNEATSGKVNTSEKEDVKNETTSSKPNSNNTSTKSSSGNTQNNTSGKNDSVASKPSTGNNNTGATSKPNDTSGSSNTTPPQTGGNTNTGSSNNNTGTTTKPEEPKERTVTVKVPMYQYISVYQIWNGSQTKLLFETEDGSEFNAKVIEYTEAGIPNTQKTNVQKEILIGYKEYTLTESDYYESNFSTRDDVIVTWN